MADACDQAAAILRTGREQLAGLSLAACLTSAGLRVPSEVASWAQSLPIGELRVAYASAPRRGRTLRISLRRHTGRQIYALLEDLTAHVRERGRLSIAMVKLERLQAVALRQGASAPLAHDLNNLLTALLGETDVALHGAFKRDPWRTLGRVQALAGRAADLSKRLLRHPPGGSEDVVRPRADVGTVLCTMEPVMRCCLDPTHELRVVAAEVPCTVRLAEAELERIVLNLLCNARDAMDVTGTVTIRSQRHADGSVELTVADTGAGMPEHVEARAFEPLYSTKSEGTGLGLAVVQRLVHDAGGHIALDTIEGRGTTVRVVFPRG